MDPTDNQHYLMMTKVIEHLRGHHGQAICLAELADAVGMSEYHFQRIFSQWAGVSPKRFQQFLSKERAKQLLKRNCSVEETTSELGFSGSSRLHDLMIHCEAMTPGEIKKQGQGLKITFGVGMTPLGAVVIAWTERGICHLAFFDDAPEFYFDELYREWPGAGFEQNDRAATEWAERIFIKPDLNQPLYLLLKGTNFQIKVWEALLRVNSAELVSYSQLAKLAGSPKASRAVGSAMAANKIGFLIPCHRVIRETGETGHYRWGPERKSALHVWEACRADQA